MGDRNHSALRIIAWYGSVGGSWGGNERGAESQRGNANHDFETHFGYSFDIHIDRGETRSGEMVPVFTTTCRGSKATFAPRGEA
jgi:hypothetical protein